MCSIYLSFSLVSQGQYLAIQKNKNVCLDSLAMFIINDSLPDSLNNFSAIFLFSNASSLLSNEDVDRIVRYLNRGGGLYVGSDNWPLQSESNQITNRLYKKESFGNFEESIAQASLKGNNLNLKALKRIPAGNSTAAFPMDYRLKVEAWVADQPLILSGQVKKGHIIIDGGYSRFYCNVWKENSTAILNEFLQFLD
jgi:hypothetical protein